MSEVCFLQKQPNEQASPESETLLKEAIHHTTDIGKPSHNMQEMNFIIPVEENIKDIKSLMNIFIDMNTSLLHIESRRKKLEMNAERNHLKFEPLEVFIQATVPVKESSTLIEKLKSFSSNVIVANNHPKLAGIQPLSNIDQKVPWFPRHISELDEVSHRVLMYGKELDCDHPGFKDAEYRKRRIMFADVAFKYRWGDRIPTIQYTESEKKTWQCVYRELTHLYKTKACREFQENLALLQEKAGYNENDLPQLQVVSDFLKIRSGFCLRPVAGYLSARDFLSGLAFRVFYCTQYIRHEKDPFYTPEPDCVHELLGHVPMLADPEFARFSQEIGLASLGTSDDEIKKLATCYFFTIEFGLCRQDNQLKAYGAGLLSSAAELQHALSDKAVVKPFIPEKVMNEECLVTTFQNGYFETSSFDLANKQMRDFAQTIKRPFDVHYNPYTQSIEIIKTPGSVAKIVQDLQFQLTTIAESLVKMDKEVKSKNILNDEINIEDKPSERV
ncbi:unnamed protein product [Heterobilharzia americana]|nr:unnamed protein product [Heterobilharzia americana]